MFCYDTFDRNLCHILSENHLPYNMNPPENNLYDLYDQTVEAALSRLNISTTPNHQSPFPFPAISGLPASQAPFRAISGIPAGQAPLPEISGLAVGSGGGGLRRSLIGISNSYMRPNVTVPLLGNASLRGLNLPWSSSTDYLFGDLEHEDPSFIAAMNRWETSELTRELSNGYLNRPYSNSNDFFQNRGNSINGLELEDSNFLMMPYLFEDIDEDFLGLQWGPAYSSLEDLRGKLYLVVKEPFGCSFLEKKVKQGKPVDIRMIFSELEHHLLELMVAQSANSLIQNLLDACNQEQITKVLLNLISDEDRFLAISLNMHGSRCVQKLLEKLTTQEQRSLIVSVLRPYSIILSKNINGHHVIQYCLKFFSYEDNKLILTDLLNECLHIATNRSGCCVLQQALARAQGEHRTRLVADITANALALSEDPFGNYVVQFILGMQIPHSTADILAQLNGHFVSLSLNKFGSNVVEKCLQECTEVQCERIIREITRSPKFLTILQHEFGNYVAQSALVISKGVIRNALVNLIQSHHSFLQSHPHGKRVLARIRRSKRQRRV